MELTKKNLGKARREVKKTKEDQEVSWKKWRLDPFSKDKKKRYYSDYERWHDAILNLVNLEKRRKS